MSEGRDRARPQDPLGSRRQRSGRLRQDRGAGEGRTAELKPELAAKFFHQAEQCEHSGSPLYADVCRRLVREPLAEAIVADDRWDRPLQLLAGLHYLALAEGIDPWRDLGTVLHDRSAWLAGFLADRTIQTNEVQRSWMLLPCFLEAARITGVTDFDLIELGPSAGLNLVWDRYRYRYRRGDWGPVEAALELGGEERRPVPSELLGLRPRVVRRIGIDREPVDVTRDDEALLLKAFVWADQHTRLKRLDHAIEVLRREPPELVRGDFVELLPDLLTSLAGDRLTLVFQTASLGYGPPEARKRVTEILEDAGRDRSLAFVSSGRPRDRSDHYYGLWLTVWPGSQPRVVVNAGFHGQWLEWLA